MDKNLAALIGMLLTDGSLTIRKNKSIMICFDSTSETLHKEFSRSLTELYQLKPKRRGIKSVVISKKIGESLLKFTPTYRTKIFPDGTYPRVEIPKEITNADEKTIQHFLKYVFTCDGSAGLSIQKGKHTKNCWYFQKRIQLACKHPKLLTEYSNLLNRLGIHNRISIKQGKLFIESTKGIQKYSQNIKFVNKVKMSGKGNSAWKGLEKNQMLEIYRKLYEISDSLGSKRFQGGYWMSNFNSKNEIIKFLKSGAIFSSWSW